MTIGARPDLYAALEDLGRRLTGPRRKVADVLSRAEGSFSAEEVLARMPEVGRATVYRTIKLLLDAGALCKTVLPDGAPRYSVDRLQHHHHVVCVQCGRVEEFRHPAVERLVRAVGGEVSGVLVGHRIELYVTCADCLTEPSPA